MRFHACGSYGVYTNIVLKKAREKVIKNHLCLVKNIQSI